MTEKAPVPTLSSEAVLTYAGFLVEMLRNQIDLEVAHADVITEKAEKLLANSEDGPQLSDLDKAAITSQVLAYIRQTHERPSTTVPQVK